ncbi:MAG: DUF4293 domain-containing protein [Bacteroidetes bacterium]|nr:DUF4293 domain-containing protein [Bacteroidota bacterium]MBS1630196.1 DUF4293 domain-containing protein [Bacteroidota bacterium]
MIQRIQSLWLFLASMLNGLLFIYPLYSFKAVVSSDPQIGGVRQHILLFVVAAVATLLPLISIFFFMARKRQKLLVWVSMFVSCLIVALMMLYVSNLKAQNPPATEISYSFPGILVTLLAIIFEVMALVGIRKDEKLLKSLDRLR